MKNKYKFLSKCIGFSNYSKVILNKSWSRGIPSRFILYKSVLLLQKQFLYSETLQRRTVKWACYCQVASVVSDSVRPHRRQPTRLPRPWDSTGKNTGMGCHFLLQCIKVKSESEVSQSCPTPSDPMDCSLPGSSIHGIFQARVLEWGAIAFSKNGLTIR